MSSTIVSSLDHLAGQISLPNKQLLYLPSISDVKLDLVDKEGMVDTPIGETSR